MRRRFIWVPVVVLVLSAGAIWLNGQVAASVQLAANPGLVVVNTPTQVKFTASLAGNSSVLPTGVNLLRLSPSGTQTVVATMRDDGAGGDTVAGDRVFTTLLNLNESQVGTFSYQASVAFRGQIRRTLSNLMQFAVLAPITIPVVLPPDPGEAGKATLQGIDSDGDGVRDDVQRYIVFKYSTSEKIRAGLMQMARVGQLTLLQSTTQTSSIANIKNFIRTQQCMESFADFRAIRDIKNDLLAELLNTKERTKVWLEARQHASGEVITVAVDPAELRTKCIFNPDLLQN